MSKTDDENSEKQPNHPEVDSDEQNKIDKVKEKDWITLTPNERVISARNPSIWPILSQMVFGAILIISGLWGAWRFGEILLLLVSIAGIVLAGYAELNRRKSWYVLTTEEIYKKFGIISVSTTSARYDDIQNAELSQNPIESLLNFGDVKLSTAGTAISEFNLENLPDPSTFNSKIVKEVDIAKERKYNQTREEAEKRSNG